MTYGDIAAVFIVMANALVDGERLPTLFLVDRGVPGIAVVDDPPFTHSYPHGHPTIRFDVAVARGRGDRRRRRRRRAAARVVRRGAARDRGARRSARCRACSRRPWPGRGAGAGRHPHHRPPGRSFPLADSAADAAAGRLLGAGGRRLYDAGADPKLVHAKAAMAKLFLSEAANRCADRCLQVFGGRGYMRTNVAERFWRELRVDRIWEGTSEIQRLMVARALDAAASSGSLHLGGPCDRPLATWPAL